MAKKQKKAKKEKPEEEDFDFTPPKFDEKEFMEKELDSSKFSFITFGFGVAGGVIASIVAIFLGLTAGFACGAFLGLTLYAIPKILSMDEEDVKWTLYLGNGFLYIVTVMAILAVATNPPMMDMTGPSISGTHWSMNDGNWTKLSEFDNEAYMGNLTETNLTLRVRVLDNADERPVVTISIDGEAPVPMERDPNGYYYTHSILVNKEDAGRNYEVEITATDSGSKTIFKGEGWPYTEKEAFDVILKTGEPSE